MWRDGEGKRSGPPETARLWANCLMCRRNWRAFEEYRPCCRRQTMAPPAGHLMRQDCGMIEVGSEAGISRGDRMALAAAGRVFQRSHGNG
jgi:hypothetical protein